MKETLKRRRNALVKGLKEFSPYILLRSIDIDFSRRTFSEVICSIAKGIPIILAGNHQSHADVIPLAHIAGLIKKHAIIHLPETRPFRGFKGPMASTVETGEQSQQVTEGYDMLRTFLTRKGLELLPVARERDILVYASSDLPSTHSNLRELLRAFDDDYGLAILIAGTVDEGRIKKDGSGRRRGMKRVNQANLLTRVLEDQHLKGVDVLVVPIAISGTFNIFDPDTRRETPEAWRAIVQNFTPFPRRLATVTVGRPIHSEDIWQKTPSEKDLIHGYLNNYVLEAIAQLILPGERGEFLK